MIVWGAIRSLLLTKHYLDNQIKQNEMGGAREVHRGHWRESLRERHHLEDTDIDGRVILKCIFKTWDRRHGLD